MVLTPGGWKHPSLVHHVEPEMSVEHHENRLRIVIRTELRTGTVAAPSTIQTAGLCIPGRHATRCATSRPGRRTGRPSASGSPTHRGPTTRRARAPEFATTTWTVPPAPRTDNGHGVPVQRDPEILDEYSTSRSFNGGRRRRVAARGGPSRAGCRWPDPAELPQ